LAHGGKPAGCRDVSTKYRIKPLALLQHLGYVDNRSQLNQPKLIKMKLLLARFMLAFMLLWLPLQGYAAQSMISCQKHHDHAQPAEIAPQESCHGQHHPESQAPTLVKANLACDDCASCHLIVQPALIVATLSLGLDTIKPAQFLSKVSFLPFFPEQPQRPPLAFFS